MGQVLQPPDSQRQTQVPVRRSSFERQFEQRIGERRQPDVRPKSRRSISRRTNRPPSNDSRPPSYRATSRTATAQD